MTIAEVLAPVEPVPVVRSPEPAGLPVLADLELPPDDRPLDPLLPPPARRGLGRLTGSVLAAAVAVAALAGFGWWRFSSPTAVDGGPGIVPSVAIASPTSGALVSQVADVRVDAHAAARVDLFVDGDWTGTDRSAPFTPAWEHRSPGPHELKAKVTSADGTVRYSEPVTVIVG